MSRSPAVLFEFENPAYNGVIIFQLYRMILAALHFNENSQRKQATTAEGKAKYNIPFSKASGQFVVKKVKTAPTYGKKTNFYYTSTDLLDKCYPCLIILLY